eukprot:5473607-Prymnesium_polylepis.1
MARLTYVPDKVVACTRRGFVTKRELSSSLGSLGAPTQIVAVALVGGRRSANQTVDRVCGVCGVRSSAGQPGANPLRVTRRRQIPPRTRRACASPSRKTQRRRAPACPQNFWPPCGATRCMWWLHIR